MYVGYLVARCLLLFKDLESPELLKIKNASFVIAIVCSHVSTLLIVILEIGTNCINFKLCLIIDGANKHSMH